MPNWVKLNQLRTLSGFPLTSLNLVSKAKGTLDPATKTLNLTIDQSLKSLDPAKQPDAGTGLAAVAVQGIVARGV